MRTAWVPTASCAAATIREPIRRSCVAYAGESGRRSSWPVSAWKATAWTCAASVGERVAAMSGHWSRMLPPAAGTSQARSAIRPWSTAATPVGSRPSRRTVVPVRRLALRVSPSPRALAASRAWCSATRARSTPDSSGSLLLVVFTVLVITASYRRPTVISELLLASLRARCTRSAPKMCTAAAGPRAS